MSVPTRVGIARKRFDQAFETDGEGRYRACRTPSKPRRTAECRVQVSLIVFFADAADKGLEALTTIMRRRFVRIVQGRIAVVAIFGIGIDAFGAAIEKLGRKLDIAGQINMTQHVDAVALNARRKRSQIRIFRFIAPLENGIFSCVAPLRRIGPETVVISLNRRLRNSGRDGRRGTVVLACTGDEKRAAERGLVPVAVNVPGGSQQNAVPAEFQSSNWSGHRRRLSNRAAGNSRPYSDRREDRSAAIPQGISLHPLDVDGDVAFTAQEVDAAVTRALSFGWSPFSLSPAWPSNSTPLK